MFSFGSFHGEKHLHFIFFQTENVFKALQDITEELRKLKFPDGSKESPARTCQQIKKNNPDAQDGRILYLFNKIKKSLYLYSIVCNVKKCIPLRKETETTKLLKKIFRVCYILKLSDCFCDKV